MKNKKNWRDFTMTDKTENADLTTKEKIVKILKSYSELVRLKKDGTAIFGILNDNFDDLAEEITKII